MLQDAPGEHRPHAKLAPNLLRIHLLSFVAKDRAAGDHTQPSKLRKVIDEALCDAVREIFGVGVAARVNEWKYGDGFDCAFSVSRESVNSEANNSKRKHNQADNRHQFMLFDSSHDIFGAGSAGRQRSWRRRRRADRGAEGVE